MPNNQNAQNNQNNAQNPQNPPVNNDKTTGDVFITEKTLEEILKKLNTQLGDEALKDIIKQQQEALDKLNKEFEEQLKDKNDKIAELEKQLNDLLVNQPLDPNNPTIGATIVELKKQIEALRQEAELEAKEQDEIKAELEKNTNEDSITKQELQTDIENLKKQIADIKGGLDPDFVLNDILKDPIKAQEIIKEILKNPHNFPPFNLNPLVDANADIFAQVRETLNTARELLRLLATIEYINGDFQKDVANMKQEMKDYLQQLLDKRDEGLNQFETLIKALESEIKNINIALEILQKEKNEFDLIKADTKYYYDETFALWALCDDYAKFCEKLKNDCITLRDDMLQIKVDIDEIKEATRNYHDKVEFWHDSIMRLDIDKLVARINQLEAQIEAMAERKREEIIQALDMLRGQILAELKEIYLDYKAFLESDFKYYNIEMDRFCREIIELIDDKKLEALDQINITTLSSLASLNEAKKLSIDLIKFQTDEGIEELTQHKTDYIVELQDTKVDSINSINEAFAGVGKSFMAEMARINNEILGIKGELIAFGKDFKTEHLTSSQTWTSPAGAKRNYFVFLQGGSGYDNTGINGEATSFGDIRSVNGGLGASAGRGSSGDSAFFAVQLNGGTSVNISVGNGRTPGFVSICYSVNN